MQKRKLIIIISAVILAAILVMVGADAVSNMINKKNAVNSDRRVIDAEKDLLSAEINGEKHERRDGIESYLIIGLDSEGPQKSSNGYYNKDQADFLLLISIDRALKKVDFLTINRDTMCDVNQLGVGGIKYGTTRQQIALAHTYGDGMQDSCENTVDAVSKLIFNTKVDYYASLTMDGVAKLTDYLGGVEVDGTLLNGEAALSFVRGRIGVDDSTNIARMQRQSKYLSALIDDIKSKDLSASYVDGAVTEISDCMLTNVNLLKVYDLLDEIKDYTFSEINTADGTVDYSGEYAEFTVDEASLGNIVIEMFYK